MVVHFGDAMLLQYCRRLCTRNGVLLIVSLTICFVYFNIFSSKTAVTGDSGIKPEHEDVPWANKVLPPNMKHHQPGLVEDNAASRWLKNLESEIKNIGGRILYQDEATLSSITSTTTKTTFTSSRIPTPRKQCNCPSAQPIGNDEDLEKLPQSTCSDEATLSGKNQKIVSFVLFESRETGKEDAGFRYLKGIEGNIEKVNQFYPGWFMRLYSDIKLVNNPYAESLCQLICQHDDLFFCPVPDLKLYPGLEKEFPTQWRFLPIGDPTVRKFVSRDLDSRPSQRERDAVEEWEQSTFPFHATRDSPHHCLEINARSWGADNDRINTTTARAIQEAVVRNNRIGGTGIDQEALRLYVYIPHHKDILIHDSYCCVTWKDSVPFPSKRIPNNEFVGSIFPQHDEPMEICPIECRNPHWKDYEYC